MSNNEHLLAKIRIYLEERFGLMDKSLMLDYVEFLNELNMI